MAAPDADGNRGLLHTYYDWVGVDAADELPDAASADVDIYDNADYGVSVMSVVTDNIDNGSLTMRMYGNNQHKNITDTPCSSDPVTTSSAINSVRTRTFNASGTLDQARSFVDSVIISRTAESNEPLFKKGAIFDLSLTNLQCYWDYTRIVGNNSRVTDCSHVNYGWGRLVVYDVSGNQHIVDCDTIDFVWSDDGKSYNVMLTTTALPVDVYSFEIQYFTDLISTFGIPQNAIDPAFDGHEGNLGTAVTYITHHTVGFYNSVLYINEHDQTTGLLQSIIVSVNNIKDGIINLPSKIANFVIDGLKSLFVPEEGFFDEYLDKWDYFLLEHFGFVYSAINTVVDIIKILLDGSSGSGTVSIPEYTFNLAGADFTIGGWDVQLVPDGFSGLITTLRLVTNIIITLLFVNLGVKKYDEIVKGGSRGDS